MSKQWNKHILDQLKDFPKKAPEGLFDDVQSEMLRRGLASVPNADKQKQFLSPIVLHGISAAAFLILLVGISYLWKEKSDNVIENMNANLPKEITLPPTPAEADKPVSTPIISVSNTYVAKAQKKVSIPVDTLSTEEENITEEEDTITNNTQQSQLKEKPRNQNHPQRKQAYTSPKRKKNPLAIGVYYSGIVNGEGNLFLIGGSNRNDNSYGMSAPNWDPSEDPNQSGTNPADSTSTSPESRSLTRETLKENTKHLPPVRFGVSLRYNLDERWNIQSGATYTYLVSDLNRYNTEVSYLTKQKLHYIGIPLQVGYKLWESKRFRAYASAGGEVQKLIGGKGTTSHFVKGKHQSTSAENISNKRLLFSALGSIGMEYALGKSISLYAEPGLHYHFKNGSSLQTYYTEHPLNVNLTLGLRFHWNKE